MKGSVMRVVMVALALVLALGLVQIAAAGDVQPQDLYDDDVFFVTMTAPGETSDGVVYGTEDIVAYDITGGMSAGSARVVSTGSPEMGGPRFNRLQSAPNWAVVGGSTKEVEP